SVISLSVTHKGQLAASRLPYRNLHGSIADNVREYWSEVDAFVLFISIGAAVRIIAPLIDSKATDPAIVCVDEEAKYVIPLIGGHHGRRISANTLAKEIARYLEGTPVITTASDSAGLPGLDLLAGFKVEGDVARVGKAILDGANVEIINPNDWPLPKSLATIRTADDVANANANARIVVSDSQNPYGAVPDRSAPSVDILPTAVLHPGSLVIGIGTSSDCPFPEVLELLHEALAEAGLAFDSISEVATIDRRADHAAVLSFGLPVRSFSAQRLSEVQVPNPSTIVENSVGTSSVCEAAALLCAGEGARLVSPKRKSARATIAIARRIRPRGRLALVGLGPGTSLHRTPAACLAILNSEVVIGYRPYVEQCADLFSPHQEIIAYPIGDEIPRAQRAIQEASAGRKVALVCSGDAGIFAMAPMTMELMEQAAQEGSSGIDFDLQIVPGITASIAASSLLGSPLGHDHAVISLSDLTTPWEVIEDRLKAAASSGMVIALYNPRSKQRIWQFAKALSIVNSFRSPNTPVGLVTNAMRKNQIVTMTTLHELCDDDVTMNTCVIIGSPDTRVSLNRMLTPRGRPIRDG
ncbi:MAG TPA: precorrin-3B C(17)-methyltransferase, partial [Acidimicrobiales bacterium]|nr:precorrin-3B C(17)-methyltransferase [Acidimicrobiales bacterium]